MHQSNMTCGVLIGWNYCLQTPTLQLVYGNTGILLTLGIVHRISAVTECIALSNVQ